MRKSILFIFFTLFCVEAFSIPTYTPEKMESLLQKLDDVIKNKNIYTEKKKQNIESIKLNIKNTDNSEKCFFLYGKLFDELKTFQMDSALAVANKRLILANKLNSTEKLFYAKMNIAEVMIVTGMYKEALDILNQVNRKQLKNQEQLQILYHLYHSLYILMAQYSFLDNEQEYYYKQVNTYKDSLLMTLPPENVGHKLVKVSELIYDRKYAAALDLANEVYIEEQDNDHIIAMLMHDVADIYKFENKQDELKFALAISSIHDIESGIKEYMSLPELASILYETDDVERAYNYIKCSLDDAIFCKARLRTIQLSQTLPLINASYDAKIKVEHTRLLITVCITLALSLILAICLIFIYKKMKELATIRRSLKNTNNELSDLNKSLNQLNEELIESNKVKEEYIGYVFSICSLYIDKLDNFRKRVNRQIKGGLTEELYRQTKSSSLVNDELKEFYKSFDTIFLKLFPNFVEDFNQLLSDPIKLKEDELTPELRIHALIRLGINDSTKIATFLHYSTQTVYNYRLKVRNKAIIDKTNFVEAIQALGKSKS